MSSGELIRALVRALHLKAACEFDRRFQLGRLHLAEAALLTEIGVIDAA